MDYKCAYNDETPDVTLLFDMPITLYELGLSIANGFNYKTMEQIASHDEGVAQLKIKQIMQWVFKETDGMPENERVYGRVGDFYNNLYNHNPELLTIIWFQLCGILEQLGTLTADEWDSMRKGKNYEAPIDFAYTMENSRPVKCRLDSAEKTVVKRLGSFPSVYEILVDFSPKTVSKRFDKERNRPIHSDKEIAILAKEDSRALRLFVTLGETIVIENDGIKYKTYRKNIRAIFDKSGMKPDEYNRITDEIGGVLCKAS